MGRSKQKARSSSYGYTNTKQLANMIGNGITNAKKIKYDLSHETCYYEHYFSYNKNQDQAINEEISCDYAPFITMAKTTNDKNNPFPRIINDKNNKDIIKSKATLLDALDDTINFLSVNFDDENKYQTTDEKYDEKTDEQSDRQIEYFLGWHETSKYDGMYGMDKYGRPSLQMVFVLDISGSMGSPFKEQGFQYQTQQKNVSHMSKIEIAKKVLIRFLDQLKTDDYFGLVVFNSETEIIHEIEQWGNTDIKAVIEKINKLQSGGGTVITTAYNTSMNMLLKCKKMHKHYEKRLFFLTDMEVSSSEGNEYTKLVSQYANSEKIYSSVTGIGLDLSNGVITRLSSTLGCNYSNVLNSDDFVEIINYEFNYMVTPIAMNIKLEILSQHEFSGGYGSFEVRNIAGKKNKKLCSQITRFPSQCNYKGERRSGVILLKLNSGDFRAGNNIVRLKISFDDVNGGKKEIFFKKDFNKMRLNEAENNGIKKAILLKNYVDFVQFYLKLRLIYNPTQQQIETFTRWNKEKFHQYFDYMVKNLVELNDASMMEELKILKWIGSHDNIKFNDSIQTNINNVQNWDNLFFCPAEKRLPALFPNFIKIINNVKEIESLIIGFAREGFDGTYDDSKMSVDILKIFSLYLLPIAWYNGKEKKEKKSE